MICFGVFCFYTSLPNASHLGSSHEEVLCKNRCPAEKLWRCSDNCRSSACNYLKCIKISTANQRIPKEWYFLVIVPCSMDKLSGAVVEHVFFPIIYHNLQRIFFFQLLCFTSFIKAYQWKGFFLNFPQFFVESIRRIKKQRF